MSYKINRTIQNEYLMMHIVVKVLNLNNYDSNGVLKPGNELTKTELSAMQELRLDSMQGVFNYIESLKKSNILSRDHKPRV